MPDPMKKIHIIGLVLIASLIGVIITIASARSRYENFTDAEKTDKEVQVVGHLNKSKDLVYDPKKDPNHFSFYMKDENGKEVQVIYADDMPQDFQRSESIVATGRMKDHVFYVSKGGLLLKCPSKYKNNQLATQ